MGDDGRESIVSIEWLVGGSMGGGSDAVDEEERRRERKEVGTKGRKLSCSWRTTHGVSLSSGERMPRGHFLCSDSRKCFIRLTLHFKRG